MADSGKRELSLLAKRPSISALLPKCRYQKESEDQRASLFSLLTQLFPSWEDAPKVDSVLNSAPSETVYHQPGPEYASTTGLDSHIRAGLTYFPGPEYNMSSMRFAPSVSNVTETSDGLAHGDREFRRRYPFAPNSVWLHLPANNTEWVRVGEISRFRCFQIS